MKISIDEKYEPKSIKVSDMPKGSIGKEIGSIEVYVVRTIGNGDDFILIWPNTSGIQHVDAHDVYILDWNVKLLPAGTKITLEF